MLREVGREIDRLGFLFYTSLRPLVHRLEERRHERLGRLRLRLLPLCLRRCRAIDLVNGDLLGCRLLGFNFSQHFLEV